MATQKKFLVFSCILVLVLVMAASFPAFAKSDNVTGKRSVETESVTGTLGESFVSDGMKFMRIVPTVGGDDVWVAVFETVSVSEGVEYTFEGPVYKNYKVKILKKKFKKIIFSKGPE